MDGTVTIIGKGKMGMALARHFEQSNISVQVLGRNHDKEIIGDFVLFAVPYEDMFNLIEHNQEKFTNKIIIDMSNPIDYQTKTSRLSPEQSTSLLLAERFPHLAIIKAFNTNFSSSRVLFEKTSLVLISGNNLSAIEKFISLFGNSQFKVLNLGALDRSRDLEAFARVQLALLEAGYVHPLQSFAL